MANEGKMSLLRQEFSVDSYPDLIEFLEVVKTCNKETKLENWSKVLPQNQDLLTKLEDYKLKKEEVIDLDSENSDEKKIDQEDSLNISCMNFSLLNNSDTENIELTIANTLKRCEVIDVDILKHLNTISNENVEEIVVNLGQILDTNSVCKFCNYLVKYAYLGKSSVAKYCFTHLIFKKMQEEDLGAFNYITDFFEIFISEISTDFVRILENINDCSKHLQINLNKMKIEHKQKVLREFVMSCGKIKSVHFSIIEALLVGQMDLGLLKKLVDMLVMCSNDNSTNKAFGKLLLTLLQKNGKNNSYFEQEFRNILSSHKSLWKSKILNYLENNGNHNLTQNFSLTMHF